VCLHTCACVSGGCVCVACAACQVPACAACGRGSCARQRTGTLGDTFARSAPGHLETLGHFCAHQRTGPLDALLCASAHRTFRRTFAHRGTWTHFCAPAHWDIYTHLAHLDTLVHWHIQTHLRTGTFRHTGAPRHAHAPSGGCGPTPLPNPWCYVVHVALETLVTRCTQPTCATPPNPHSGQVTVHAADLRHAP
jgi:hypothetical protein